MAAKSKRMSSDGDLPLELWRKILIRLPVKSILRCRSVHKSWYSLISSPDFISHYSTRNLNKNGNRVLLRVFDKSNIWSYSSHNESFTLTESREHDDIPKKFHGDDLDIVGSCNGLICLSKYDPSEVRDESVVTFLIWNPTIRKVVELPSRTFRPRTQYASFLGFGFDSNTNDYKVLMSFSMHRKKGGSTVVETMCEVFDMRKGVWRVINLTVHRWNVWSPTSQECYLNGAVHWSGFKSGDDLTRILLSFDMSDECFRLIKLPDCVDFTLKDDYGNTCIETNSMTIGGLVYVIAYKIMCDDEIDMSWSCSLWAMKEYGVTESWTKVSNIDLQSFVNNSIDNLWPQRFYLWENGEVLVVHDHCDDGGHKQDFVLYNTEDRKFERIFSTTKCFKNLCRYEESLVLM